MTSAISVGKRTHHWCTELDGEEIVHHLSRQVIGRGSHDVVEQDVSWADSDSVCTDAGDVHQRLPDHRIVVNLPPRSEIGFAWLSAVQLGRDRVAERYHVSAERCAVVDADRVCDCGVSALSMFCGRGRKEDLPDSRRPDASRMAKKVTGMSRGRRKVQIDRPTNW